MNISHKNHYEEIGTFIMCYPSNFKLLHFSLLKKLNKNKMFKQYNDFINLLINQGSKVQFLEPIYGANQVFTRDVGFVIDDILFISKMANKNRAKETLALEEYIKDKHKKIYKMKNPIEGGDVLIYNDYIFVGMSNRTSMAGALELGNYLKSLNKIYTIIPINFNKDKMLHLDCVFNILDDNHAVISNYVYDKAIIQKIIKNLYYLDNKTTCELGTNFINLGKKRIVTSHKKVKKLLEKLGYKVFYLDYSEILKAGGGFACSTLPVFRK